MKRGIRAKTSNKLGSKIVNIFTIMVVLFYVGNYILTHFKGSFTKAIIIESRRLHDGNLIFYKYEINGNTYTKKIKTLFKEYYLKGDSIVIKVHPNINLFSEFINCSNSKLEYGELSKTPMCK
jgi:hypothetical protein